MTDNNETAHLDRYEQLRGQNPVAAAEYRFMFAHEIAEQSERRKTATAAPTPTLDTPHLERLAELQRRSPVAAAQYYLAHGPDIRAERERVREAANNPSTPPEAA